MILRVRGVANLLASLHCVSLSSLCLCLNLQSGINELIISPAWSAAVKRGFVLDPPPNEVFMLLKQ